MQKIVYHFYTVFYYEFSGAHDHHVLSVSPSHCVRSEAALEWQQVSVSTQVSCPEIHDTSRTKEVTTREKQEDSY